MDFLNYGYYIIEPVSKPEVLTLKCVEILTPSECICNLHPSLKGALWSVKRNTKYFPLKTNELGLIQNDFAQVKQYSKYIENMGEPVLWLPFAIYDITY